jgi:hypothetical protein
VVSLRRLALTMAAGALVVVLAGFGGAPGAVPEKKTPAVCKLLTTREAAKILATAVNKGKEKKVPPPAGAKARQCEWASKKKGVGGIEGSPFKLQVELTTGSNVAADYEKAKARVDLDDLVTVPDLGTEAFYDDSPFGGVHVLAAEDKVLSAKVTNYNTAKADLPQTPEQMSIDAAKIAVGRLTTT